MSPFERLEAQLADAMKAHLAGGRIAVPPAGRLAWQWFSQLSSTRMFNPAGPNPIAHAEILAWARLYRWPIRSRHVDLIRALDDAWLVHFHEARRADRQDVAKLPPRSGHEVSPALFDALFGGAA